MNLNVRIAPAASKRQGMILRGALSGSTSVGGDVELPESSSGATTNAPATVMASAQQEKAVMSHQNAPRPQPTTMTHTTATSNNNQRSPAQIRGVSEHTCSGSNVDKRDAAAADDDESQFLRCIFLLNLVVAEQLRAGGVSADCGGFIVHPPQQHGNNNGKKKDSPSIQADPPPSVSSSSLSASQSTVRTSSKVTVLRRETRMARLANVLPLQITVYGDAIAVVDWNGPESHQLLLAGIAADAADGADAVPEVYVSRGATRNSIAENRVAGRPDGLANVANPARQSLPHDREDGDGLLMVFAGRASREAVLHAICRTHLPRCVAHAYPEGVRIEPSWRNAESIQPTLAAFWARRTEEGATTTRLVPPNGSLPLLASSRLHCAGGSDDKGRDTAAAALSIGHRLGGTVRKTPHDRVLPKTEFVAPSTECRSNAAKGDAITTANVSTPSVSECSLCHNKPAGAPVVTVLSPLGSLVFPRRVNTETWGDVRRWLERERALRCSNDEDDGGAVQHRRSTITLLQRGAEGAVPLRDDELVGERGCVVCCRW